MCESAAELLIWVSCRDCFTHKQAYASYTLLNGRQNDCWEHTDAYSAIKVNRKAESSFARCKLQNEKRLSLLLTVLFGVSLCRKIYSFTEIASTISLRSRTIKQFKLSWWELPIPWASRPTREYFFVGWTCLATREDKWGSGTRRYWLLLFSVSISNIKLINDDIELIAAYFIIV